MFFVAVPKIHTSIQLVELLGNRNFYATVALAEAIHNCDNSPISTSFSMIECKKRQSKILSNLKKTVNST